MCIRRSIVLPVAFASAFAAAQDPKVEFTFDSTLYSKYVWRGINLVNGPVLQPSLTAAYGGWSLNLWGNLELDDTNDYGVGFGSGKGQFTEVDTTLAFGAEAGEWNWSAGYIRYDFPNTPFAQTSEVFATATHASEWSPTIKAFIDVEAAKCSSAQFGVSKAWAAGDGEVKFSTGLGYGDSKYCSYYLGSGKSGLTDFNAGLTYTKAVGPNASLNVYGSFSSLLSKDFVPGSGRMDNFFFGVGVTVGF